MQSLVTSSKVRSHISDIVEEVNHSIVYIYHVLKFHWIIITMANKYTPTYDTVLNTRILSAEEKNVQLEALIDIATPEWKTEDRVLKMLLLMFCRPYLLRKSLDVIFQLMSL